MLLLMPVAGLFRAGNASPMGNLAGLMKRVLSAMRGMKVRFRSDSAGFQAKVVRVLRAAGVDYTITARKDAAVMEAIRSIPAGNRKRYEGGAWKDRETELAEADNQDGAVPPDPTGRGGGAAVEVCVVEVVGGVSLSQGV